MPFILTIILLAAECCAENADGRISSEGFAMFSKDGNFRPYEFERHPMGSHDILIKTLYCGICHSDIHQARSDWREEEYPIVPGHEIVGEVVRVGKDVTKFRVGDIAGVGCMVNSCRECEYCVAGMEQYCLDGRVLTYADKDIYHENEATQGGYSSNMVIEEAFALQLPKDAPLEKIGPLMCAGVTVWSPIMRAKIKAGDKVGVAGFGGLGHLAVKYLAALGAEVTVFDITEEKRAAAMRMGAKKYINVLNEKELDGMNNRLCFILSTIPVKYDPMLYVNILKVGGTLAVVGLPAAREIPRVGIGSLRGRYLTTSIIGGIRETQEMLDYSLANGIFPETVLIPADAESIDMAWKNVADGKVKFRYVIDFRDRKDLKKDENMKTEFKVKIKAGEREAMAVLEDNAASRAFMARLPLTLPMMDLYGREMCHRFAEALPTDEVNTRGYEVGEIVYYPPRRSFVILYGQNGERFPMQKLGRIISGVKVFLDAGDMDVSFEAAE